MFFYNFTITTIIHLTIIFIHKISFLFSDVSYGYVIDQQPIGRILFRLFCENKRPLYYRYIAFLDNVTRWVLYNCFFFCVFFFACRYKFVKMLFYLMLIFNGNLIVKLYYFIRLQISIKSVSHFTSEKKKDLRIIHKCFTTMSI